LEQLAGILEGSGQTSVVAAGGSGAWGVGCEAGQCGWPSATGARHGTADGTGNEPAEFGLEALEAGLVLGAERISGGIVGVDRREARQTALWRGAEGVGRTEGGATDRNDATQGGLDGIGIGAAAQRGSQESANGDAPAHRNHDDLVVDCGAVGDGALADGAKCNPRGRLKRANQ